MTESKKKSFIINVIFIALIVLLVYFGFKYLFGWIFPFLIGAAVAIALQKPIDWLTAKTRFSRTLWSLLLVCVTFVVLIFIVGFIAMQLLQEILAFFRTLPGYVPGITSWLSQLSTSLDDAMTGLPDQVTVQIRDIIVNTPKNLVTPLADWATGFAGSTAMMLPSLLISTIITIVACCFVTKDYYLIAGFFKKQLSAERWEIVVEAKDQFMKNTLKMLRGYAMIMSITFAELAIGLTILRIPYSIAIALLISFVDILPVVGTGTVMIPWAIICIATGNLWIGIGLLVVYGIITVIRYIIEPKIIGKQVGLQPIVTLFIMFVGLQLFGILGLFGFPIILIILKNLQDTGKIRIWK